ncbi:MAG: hypothetical protein HGA96_05545 [Desulfobulbaceae bacterium]|nr:hypothetical protein [Desulfobulbaceae bacterium]
MQVKVRKGAKMAVKLGAAGAFLIASGMFSNLALAKVVGPCANCHTMHNSQNNSAQVVVRETNVGTAAGWNVAGTDITGGAAPTEVGQGRLLKFDCVSCHTNTGPSTTVSSGGNIIPIVYNTGGYPNSGTTATTPLAGGNFNMVATNAAYGHNVRGISPKDGQLSTAPGQASGCGTSCHDDLTLTDGGTQEPSVEYAFNGCKGCHNQVGHHKVVDTSYRYLGGHGAPGMTILPGDDGTNSFKDTDWEQTKSDTDHNIYKAGDVTNINDKTTIGAFCAGCHGHFHALGNNNFPLTSQRNGGDANTEAGGGLITANSTPISPWTRHPSNVRIPLGDPAGEYAALDGALYNPDVPVAQMPGAGDYNVIDYGDQVTCVSCHRAHASNFADSLRWDYSTMNAHGGANATGCFFCHTTKDD